MRRNLSLYLLGPSKRIALVWGVRRREGNCQEIELVRLTALYLSRNLALRSTARWLEGQPFQRNVVCE